MSKFYVEVIHWKTGEVVKRVGPTTESSADKVERGMLINMNHEEYGTRIVEDKKDSTKS